MHLRRGGEESPFITFRVLPSQKGDLAQTWMEKGNFVRPNGEDLGKKSHFVAKYRQFF